MSTELKAKIRQCWEDAFNRGNVDALDEILAPDYVRHKSPFSDITGIEAEKQFVKDSRTSYPDVHLTMEQLVIEGNMTASLWTFEGTQRGVSPTTGTSPRNKHISFQGCDMSRMEGGKIVETWEVGDYLGLLQQLDVVAKFG